MSSDKPCVKWNGKDWLGDPQLRMAGPELRGVWMDMLCAMMEAEPYGHLAINGRPMTDMEVSSLIGVSPDAYRDYLERLFDLGIPSRTESGIIYSRRLLRDYAMFVSGKVSGKKGGGNPALRTPDSEYPGDFLDFWEEYPRKTGKGAALKAWKRIKRKPGIAVILDAIAAQKTSTQWTKNGGQFIPHPATWINQERWNDVPENYTDDRLFVPRI